MGGGRLWQVFVGSNNRAFRWLFISPPLLSAISNQLVQKKTNPVPESSHQPNPHHQRPPTHAFSAPLPHPMYLTTNIYEKVVVKKQGTTFLFPSSSSSSSTKIAYTLTKKKNS